MNARAIMPAMVGVTFGLAAAMVAATPVSAVPITVTLGDGFSKDNPTAFPGDLSSSLGASVAGSVIGFDPTAGIFSALMVNSGAGVVTGFAFKLNDSLFNNTYDQATFNFSAVDCPVGCNFTGSVVSSSVAAGGFGDFDVGSVRVSMGGVNNGLNVGESALFTWDFSGLGLDFSGVTTFLDVIDFNSVTIEDPAGIADDVVFDAFWVARVQVLGPEGEDSDRIGGQFTTTQVPEPGTLALIGAGLLGLGLLRRRRQAA